ncbi:sigma-54 interaction domain-containing protein [Candidatus Formimonas warabiya]|uniref:Sigma-54 factor interaction domain-containing protein n=1 Tax=Formimonas warabiya TaxID=1761012 RepID=A0A3G1KMS4_FORW1|nr:sigma 54-interacting transcriptional regulator [Candidatus Formimonas warabiya]ATW23791.1 hypothetical protein DCMF_02375 [Candidatus Formimonas warabiya]
MAFRIFIQDEKMGPALAVKSYCSEAEWHGLLKAKEDFLVRDIDPRLSTCVSQELAESWIRSRDYGVNPNKMFSPLTLPQDELENLINTNKQLIDIVKSHIMPFCQLASPSGYEIAFHDRNGILIFLDGISKSLEHKKSKYKVGMVFQEETIGTNIFSLCKRYAKPVQLLAPEVYATTGEFDIVSAANIMNEDGDLLGVLVYRQINQQLTEKPWLKDYQDIRLQTLGFITAMAQSIEAQLKLRKSYFNLETSHKMLEAMLHFFGEGIVIIDSNGDIIKINSEGKRILRVGENEPETNISQYLSDKSRQIDLIGNNNFVDYYEEILQFPNNSTQSIMISSYPIKNQISNQVEASVLRLAETKKFNAMAAKRVGTIARFNFQDIIGESKTMQRVKLMANRFAVSTENVLLLGENGTGKELFAQSIHNKYRPNQPFVALNCAAFPRNLIESELFGYEGGAFTGAERTGRPGKIELANKGTLFLDEIGDMPYEIQAILLRVLQDKQVMRIGGHRSQPVGFRVIASTNQDLHRIIKDKQFREDLYYRLSILTIEIPPLRERGYDIIRLANYFIKNYSCRMGWPIPVIRDEVQEYILAYHWPGNVRQLENAMIYACNMTEGGYIDLSHLPIEITENGTPFSSNSRLVQAGRTEQDIDGADSLKELEKKMLQNFLDKADSNIVKAAKLMGISRSTMYRKLKKYQINY